MLPHTQSMPLSFSIGSSSTSRSTLPASSSSISSCRGGGRLPWLAAAPSLPLVPCSAGSNMYSTSGRRRGNSLRSRTSQASSSAAGTGPEGRQSASSAPVDMAPWEVPKPQQTGLRGGSARAVTAVSAVGSRRRRGRSVSIGNTDAAPEAQAVGPEQDIHRERPLLLLVDGHSIAHRAYWAMNNPRTGGGLATSKGVSTSVSSQFLKMLTDAVRKQRPDALAITFDDSSSFRKPMHALLSYLADEEKSHMNEEEFVGLMKGLCNILKPPSKEAEADAAQRLGVEPVDVKALPGIVASKLPPDVAELALAAPSEEGKGYKALRKERPAGFDQDVHNLRVLLGAMRLPVLSGGRSSLEADDILSGLADQGAEAGYEIRVVSGDQDLFQLVDDARHIGMLYSTAYSPLQLVNEAWVTQKMGVPPSKVPDYKALVGDSSDNVPGVTGIGPKNGASLLQKYGTLDNVYENLPSLSKSIREKLESGKRQAYLSRFLCLLSDQRVLRAGMHTGVISSIQALKLQGFRSQEVAPLLQSLEMFSMLQQMPSLQALVGGEAITPLPAPITVEDLQLVPAEAAGEALSDDTVAGGEGTVAAPAGGAEGTAEGTAEVAAEVAEAVYTTSTSVRHSGATPAAPSASPPPPPSTTTTTIPAAAAAAPSASPPPSTTTSTEASAATPSASPPPPPSTIKTRSRRTAAASPSASSPPTTTTTKTTTSSTAAAAATLSASPSPPPAPSATTPPPTAGATTPSAAAAQPGAAPPPPPPPLTKVPRAGSVNAVARRRRGAVRARSPPSSQALHPHQEPATQDSTAVADMQHAQHEQQHEQQDPRTSLPLKDVVDAGTQQAQHAQHEQQQDPRTSLPLEDVDAGAQQAQHLQHGQQHSHSSMPSGGVANVSGRAVHASMPLHPLPEPLTHNPSEGKPYSTQVASLDAVVVGTADELRPWVHQIIEDGHACMNAPNVPGEPPAVGNSHLPFLQRHHLSLALHFAPRPTKSRSSSSRTAADPKSTPAATTPSTEFQPPKNIVPPLAGISLCWSLPASSPPSSHSAVELQEEQQEGLGGTSVRGSGSSSSSGDSSSVAPAGQPALLRTVYVACSQSSTGAAGTASQSRDEGMTEADVLAELLPLLRDPLVPIATDNLKALHHIGLRNAEIIGPSPLLQGPLMDTVLAAYVLGSEAALDNNYEPNKLAAAFQVPRTAELQKAVSMHGEVAAAKSDKEQQGVRGAVSASAQAWCLAACLACDLQASGRNTRELLEETELPLAEVLAVAEVQGLGFDTEGLQKIIARTQDKLDEILQRIIEISGWESKKDGALNLSSASMIENLLFKKIGLQSELFERTETKQLKVAKQALERHVDLHQVIPMIVDWRDLAHCKCSILENLAKAAARYKNGRIFPTYLQNAAATGRLAANEPNVMAINKDELMVGGNLRGLFVPAVPGWRLLSADYSQVELRINAHFSREPLLVDAFKSGQDVHKRTAMRLFGKASLEEVTPQQRQMAKETAFGLIYGMGQEKLRKDNKISKGEAATFMKHFETSMPQLKAFMESAKEKAKTHGVQETLFGRKRYFFEKRFQRRYGRAPGPGELMSINSWKMAAEELRQAGNMPLQGTTADLIKKSLVAVHHELKARSHLRARLLMSIHDELLVEAPPEEQEEVEQLVCTLMRTADKGLLSCPLQVDAQWGANWKEAK